jgi:hypothetical protein
MASGHPTNKTILRVAATRSAGIGVPLQDRSQSGAVASEISTPAWSEPVAPTGDRAMSEQGSTYLAVTTRIGDPAA